MNNQVVSDLRKIVGEDWVITELDQKLSYLYDELEVISRPQADENSIVVKPKNTLEVSEIMKYVWSSNLVVVVRGGGTGLCGGAIPTEDSIIISLERLKSIYEIDKKNMLAVLGAGVTLFELLEELDKHDGIGFPVHPGDEGAQIGGMAATNAGGARAVRHGIMRNHIKGIEVVLPDGEVLELGGKLVKDNSGYSLMHLIIGSEGTLAIITKVILKIYPEDHYTASIAASFNTIRQASDAVLDMLQSGVTPLAVEYQDKMLNIESARSLGLKWPLHEGLADLYIVLSEKTEDTLYKTCQQILDIFEENGSLESVFAGKKQEQHDLLAIRSGSYEIIKDIISYSFDMVVPPSTIPVFFEKLVSLAEKYDTSTNITAHIADGNVHNDILLVDGAIAPYAEELKNKMYALCLSLGGSISGEHGIGKLRMDDLLIQKKPREIQLMQEIKQVFDPKFLLNPDTIIKRLTRSRE
ncbi:MAG: FAD-binding oxidoreductase [Dethiosulfatibacter sp.]|nr:FAD-binding oxidoreductase [Dethiosulfatibacter sp.]